MLGIKITRDVAVSVLLELEADLLQRIQDSAQARLRANTKHLGSYETWERDQQTKLNTLKAARLHLSKLPRNITLLDEDDE